MLSKKNRADKKLVERVFKEGKFVNSPNLTFKFIKNTDVIPKISFVVPKTVSKKAVDRNLLRRRGYAILKKYFTLFPIGFAGVIVFGKKSKEIFSGRKNKIRKPVKELEKEIKNLLNKINLK